MAMADVTTALASAISVTVTPTATARPTAATPLRIQLQEAADLAEGTVDGRGPTPGTLKHSLFERILRSLGRTDANFELSYKGGEVVRRGKKESVRFDVVERSLESPTQIF